jgi:hypothetical protein
MTCITSYNDTNFRAMFPAFADVTVHPMAQLQANWTMGTVYIVGGYGWTCPQLQLAQDLMAAHLTLISSNIANGIPNGVIVSAGEGTVSIGMMPPPVKSAFGYWLAGTPYGAQLRALLLAVANVGLYVGGSLERASFRKAGGVF